MRRNGYLCTSGVNLDTAVLFADPVFLLVCKISAIRRCFTLIFAFNILIVRHISTSGFLTYWPRKYTTRIDLHVDNFHQVWSWYDRTLPSYSVLPADTSRDFVTLTIDLLTLNNCYAWQVTLSTLLPSLKTLRLSVLDLSHNVSRWLPLKMRTRPLRMRRITWPVCRGSKTITFLVCWTPICLFTMELRWLYDESN